MAITTGLALAAAGSAVGGLASASAAKKGADASAGATAQANETERYIFDKSVELTEPQRKIGNNANAALAFLAGVGERPTFGGNQLAVEEYTEANPAYQTNVQNAALQFLGADGDDRDQYRGAFHNPTSVATPDQPANFTRFRVGDHTFNSRDAADQYAANNSTGGFEYQGFEASPGYEFRKSEGMSALGRMASARGMRLSGATLKDAGRFGDGLASQEFGNYWNRLAGLSGAGQSATSQQISAGNNYASGVGANLQNAGAARASGYMGQANAFNGAINNGFSIYGAYKNGLFD